MQCIDFIFGYDKFEVIGLFKEITDDQVVAALEILGNSLFKVFCLADIEEFLTGFKKIDARFSWYILIVFQHLPFVSSSLLSLLVLVVGLVFF